MRSRISRIIANIGEIFSLIIPMMAIATITIVLVAMPCIFFAVLTGFIPVMTAVKYSAVVGSLLACAILTALIDHYRHCDSGCRRAAQ